MVRLMFAAGLLAFILQVLQSVQAYPEIRSIKVRAFLFFRQIFFNGLLNEPMLYILTSLRVLRLLKSNRLHPDSEKTSKIATINISLLYLVCFEIAKY